MSSQEKQLREKTVLGRVTTLMQDSVVYGMLMAISKFAILLILPIYTSFLSSEEYGILDTIILSGTVITTILIMGQDETLGRFFYDSDKKERNSLVATALAIMVVCTVMVVALSFLFTNQIVYAIFNNTQYTHEFRLIILYAVVTTFLNFFRALARWNFDKKTFFALSVGPTVTIFLLTLLAVAVLKMGIRGAIYAQIIANGVFILFSLCRFRSLLFSVNLKKFINLFLKYGTPIMIMSAVGSAANVIDKSLYIKLVGDSGLGIYALGYRYALFMSIPLTAFWIAWGPMIFSIYKEKNANDTVRISISLFAIIFSMALVLQAALAEPVVLVLASSEYLDSVRFAIPLALSFIFEIFSNLTATGINIAKKTYLNTIATIIGLIISVGAAYLLVPLMGATGIAYAVLVGRILTYTIRTYASYYVHPFRYSLAKPHLVLASALGVSLIILNVHFQALAITILFRFITVLVFTVMIWWVFFDRKVKKAIATQMHAARAKNHERPLSLFVFYHAMELHGGAPKVYAQITSHWADDKGYTVNIMNHYGHERSAYPISDKVKIETACPVYRGNPGRIGRTLLAPLLLPKLLMAILQEKPDILIVNNSPYYGLLLGTFVARAIGIPIIIWKHSGVHMLSSPFYKVAKKYCFPKADAIVALTDGDARFSRNRHTVVIKNPYIPPTTDYNAPKKEKIVLNVGRIVEQKSLHHLLMAWHMVHDKIPEWKLMLVGDGVLRPAMQLLTNKLGISNSVSFEGSSSNVDAYYQRASIFAMSSMHEGLPLVLIEALSYNLPLISYDCPYGPAEIIENNVNGLLVENGNKDALAEAILTLTTDDSMRERFRAAATDKMKDFYLNRISAQWDIVLTNVLERREGN